MSLLSEDFKEAYVGILRVSRRYGYIRDNSKAYYRCMRCRTFIKKRYKLDRIVLIIDAWKARGCGLAVTPPIVAITPSILACHLRVCPVCYAKYRPDIARNFPAGVGHLQTLWLPETEDTMFRVKRLCVRLP